MTDHVDPDHVHPDHVHPDRPNLAYPPYGYMVLEWEKLTRKPLRPPPAWQADFTYDQWRDKIVDLLSRVLWPRYRNGAWEGPAMKFMDAITDQDFELLKILRPKIDEQLTLGSEAISQYRLFIIEDESDAVDAGGTVRLDRSVDATLRKYLANKAEAPIIEQLASGYIAGIGAKAGIVDLDLKNDMQRPRAYQVAFLKGIPFSHQHAKSAVTPSMISGHCLEMLMGGLAAFFRARDLGCSVAALAAIAQHAVDCGDRRVYAGVHYPSDNISSWITGLLLAPLVSPGNEGREWLWQAISELSVVYREIGRAIDDGRGESYKLSMALLQGIGAGRIKDVDEALESVRSAPDDSHLFFSELVAAEPAEGDSSDGSGAAGPSGHVETPPPENTTPAEA